MKTKKTKENPLTFFRKANEARQSVVKKSLKKAQDGIEMNNDLINKAGSTGGYKASEKKWWLGEENMPNFNFKNNNEIPKYLKPTKVYTNPEMDPSYNSNPPASSNFSGPKSLSKRISNGKKI